MQCTLRRMLLKRARPAAPAHSILFAAFCLAIQPSSIRAQETLYNGVVLPPGFPLPAVPTQAILPVTYLTNPPAVIPINIGRQLFVDDFLIDTTNLKRTAHRPVFYGANPVLSGGTGRDFSGLAFPYSDGVWYDPDAKLFKMWYDGGGGNTVGYAVSADGKSWIKPSIPDAAIPNSNLVLAIGGSRESNTVWRDALEPDPARRYKSFASYIVPLMNIYFSADGIHWGDPFPNNMNSMSDRPNVFYNPFRKVWVEGARLFTTVPATATNPTHDARIRFYSESRDLVSWTDPTGVFWTGPDDLDPPYVPGGALPELYSLDAVAYESVLVGLFSWFNPGPSYQPYYAPGPNLVEIGVGFSRDGFQWVRPTRGSGANAFIPASNIDGTWNCCNTQSVGGGFLVVGDELWFYFSARDARKPATGNGSTGLATLRRDGFYSMDGGPGAAGVLTTRPVSFTGNHLFVNAAAAAGGVQAEVLDTSGNVIAPFSRANSSMVNTNTTRSEIAWAGGDLGILANRPVKFRFYVTNASLYSFWVTPSPSAASFGYLAAGGPGLSGPADTAGAPVPAVTSVSPVSGSGANQTFQFAYSDAGGYTNLRGAYVLVGSGLAAANSCMVEYDVVGNALRLLSDSGGSWLGPVTFGGAGTVSNSQCSINAAASSVTAAGPNLTLMLALSFLDSYSGVKTVYGNAFDIQGFTSTWQALGTWNVIVPPRVVSLTPSSGSGPSQTFRAVYANSTGGAAGITSAFVLINSVLTASKACYVMYEPAGNALFLNDSVNWIGPVTPGSNATLQSNQCRLNAAGSSASITGASLTMNVSLTFRPAFAGPKTVFQSAITAVATTGFQIGGTWTVPTFAPPTAGPLSPASGSGIAQVFTAQYSYSGGASEFTSVFFLLNTEFTANNACYVMYQPAGNGLYLSSSGSWLGPITPGSAGGLQNNQCVLNGAGSSVGLGGTTVTLSVSLTFNAAFVGPKTAFIFAFTLTDTTGIQTGGTWTVPIPGPAAGPLTPASGSGASQVFTAQYTNPGGASGFTNAFLLINTSFAAANACYAQYQPASNSLFLYDGTTWLGPITPGTTATVTGSQCVLNALGSSAIVAGNTLTLNVSLTFKAAFAGTKTVFIFAFTSSATTGFPIAGTWTVPATAGGPTAGPLSPVSGSGTSQVFTAQYTNPGGASAFTNAFLLMNTSFAAANACYVQYQPASNSLFLNDGITWLGPITPGTAATLTDSQCALSASGSSASVVGNTLTLNLSLAFKPAFAGAKVVFMFAFTPTATTGFVTAGAWTAQ